MKSKFILVFFLNILFFPAIASAQNWVSIEEVDSTGRKVHQRYLTNEWRDNLFLGGTVGISTRMSLGAKSDITKIWINPDLNVFLLKWFTPEIGARIGYQGFNGREGLNYYHPYQINHSPLPYKLESTGEFVQSSGEPGTLHYGMMHWHLDLMWNIINTFKGFDLKHKFEISFYLAGGYLRIWDNKTKGNRGIGSSNFDQEFTLGAGFYGTYKITDRLLAVGDLRWTNHASRYRSNNGARTNVPALSVGVAYNLFKTYWTQESAIAMSVSEARDSERRTRELLAEVEESNAVLEKEVEDLSAELSANKAPEPVKEISYKDLKQRADNADLVVFFYINQTTLNFSELHHLDAYVKTMLELDPDHVFKVTGSADKGTGSSERNKELSSGRAAYIKNLLIEKYGVKPENIVTSTVVTDKNVEAALDRCALFER